MDGTHQVITRQHKPLADRYSSMSTTLVAVHNFPNNLIQTIVWSFADLGGMQLLHLIKAHPYPSI